MLDDDRRIEEMPRLRDYLGFGVEVIADKVGNVAADDPEPEMEDDERKSA